MTVAKEPGHRGEREGHRNTIAQGKPVCSGYTCGPTPVLSVAPGPWVQSAPGFPCALCFERGRNEMKSSGNRCRENADSHHTQPSLPAKAGNPVRRGFSILSLAS